ncbi:MAG: hypothetical protein IJ617_06310, partial [Oscillospiraceae bacterium]|nr:hypothetical protein [Oscillospiraceae bacterium]
MRVALANGRTVDSEDGISYTYLEGRDSLAGDNFAQLGYNLSITDSSGDASALHLASLASANVGDEIHIGNYKIIITASETDLNTGRIKWADLTQAANANAKINQFLVNRGFDSAQVEFATLASTEGIGDRLTIKGFTAYETADELESKIGTVKYLTKAQLDAAKGQSSTDSSSSSSSGSSGSSGGSSSAASSGGLLLQIGDDNSSYNQLNVQIKSIKMSDMFSSSGGKIDLTGGTGATNAQAQAASTKAMGDIKDAIEYVSDIRGLLGATQNRLEHTINNLSVMRENIQDAESTIRDTDVAEEMMKYTKNSILNQSAQAMLAQANQLPQGV